MNRTEQYKNINVSVAMGDKKILTASILDKMSFTDKPQAKNYI